MDAADQVSLDPEASSDATLLANLLELYIHDLSAVFPHVELGPDGRFGYRRLPMYWTEPDRRFQFIIRPGGHVAGFVLVQRGSPANPDPDGYDVDEFFVLRRYRRTGVGREAAFQLWNNFPGAWTVRVLENNRGALDFWRGVIAEYAKGTATEAAIPDREEPWRIFTFRSTAE